jgi:hypothetical protein
MKEKLGLLAITLFIMCCIPFALLRLIFAILTNSEKAWNVLVAFDRVGNAALNGDPRETISSRAYRGTIEGNKSWCLLCKILNEFQPDHCKQSAGS